MVALTNTTLSLTHFTLSSSSASSLPFNKTFNFQKPTTTTHSYSLNFGFNNLPLKYCKLTHKRVYSSLTDEGSESEFDNDDDEEEEEEEDEEEEEEDLDFESVDGSRTLVTSNYEEDLVKEVEQLLSSKEKEILQQNQVPNLTKISAAKWNPLHTFTLAGQIRYMDDLIENGVDIDIIDKDGLTALHLAIIGKKEAVISHLLRKGANPQLRDLDGATPLHYAVQVGAMQTVKLLIKYKVDLNVADNEGWTPLHVAVQSRNRDIVKILLINGADKSRRNKDDRTPLDIAFCYGKDFKSYDLTKLLKIVPANRE